MVATPNDLEIKLGHILNAYILTPVKGVDYLGSEFSKDTRKTAVIIRALYGLKSTKAACRSHLARCMESTGYQSCKADPDLWPRSEMR